MSATPNATAASVLRSYVDRLGALEDDKRAVSADIAEVKKEISGQGFDLKVIAEVLKRRRKGRAAVDEFDTMVQLYEASLGDLGGTPLGEAARRKLEPPEPGEDGEGADPADGLTAAPPEPSITPEAIEEARQLGRDDAKAGKKVLENPFTAGDPRRAAWDEGWCAELGSDGMEIPAALRRKEKPKKKKKGDGGEGAEGSAP